MVEGCAHLPILPGMVGVSEYTGLIRPAALISLVNTMGGIDHNCGNG